MGTKLASTTDIKREEALQEVSGSTVAWRMVRDVAVADHVTELVLVRFSNRSENKILTFFPIFL